MASLYLIQSTDMRTVLRALLMWLLSASTCTVFAAPPLSSQQMTHKKYVFAHYMVCCPTAGPGATIADFKAEILAAERYGIDGFALNVGGWQRSEPHYKQRVLALYQAAEELKSDFVLFVSIDGRAVEELDDILLTVRDAPAQFRIQGRPVISSFGGQGSTPDEGRALARRIKSSGAIFVPYFIPSPFSSSISRSRAEALSKLYPELDGYFLFGAAGTIAELAGSIKTIADAFRGLNKIVMIGVSPFYRGKGQNYRVFESEGFVGMARQWRQAIDSNADWVQLVTWNDWAESTYLAPFGTIADTQLWAGHFGKRMLSHVAYLEASRPYIEWFKSGKRPEKWGDSLFYFYRLYPKSAQPAETPTPCTSRPSGFYTLKDEIFLTVYLKSEATLLVHSPELHEIRLQPGESHISVPLRPSTPVFALKRDGRIILYKSAEFPISPFNDSSCFNYFSGSADALKQ